MLALRVQDGRRMSRPFAAKYAGRCGWCNEPITVGDRVVYIDDELIHASRCPAGDTGDQVCPECSLVLPTSGVCGVCE